MSDPRRVLIVEARFYEDIADSLIAGATDVGLWVTKGLRDLGEVAFLNRCRDLQDIEVRGDTLRIGAGVTMAALLPVLRKHHPSYAEMVRRYGSEQVRQAARQFVAQPLLGDATSRRTHPAPRG